MHALTEVLRTQQAERTDEGGQCVEAVHPITSVSPPNRGTA
jgi:hypothetical protein